MLAKAPCAGVSRLRSVRRDSVSGTACSAREERGRVPLRLQLGLAESKRQYELTGKRLRLGELKKQLLELKNTEAAWLYEVSAHIGQSALKDLNVAFERFFRSVKGEGPKAGYPRFKRKGERDSARIYEVTLEHRHLRMPNLGRVRLKETCREREFEGRVLAATICRRAYRWFVSLTVEREREIILPKPVRRSRDIVGVDLGLANAAVISDGVRTRVVEPQRALRKNLARLRRLDRALARTQNGSANREKAKLRRARFLYRVSCQRQEMLHQLSSELARTKRVILLEDLHVRGMQRNKHLALSVGDAGMGELRRQLAYKCEWYGATLVLADRWYPSSKLCSGCGTIKDTLAIGEREYNCGVCGLVLDRDENAAVNLRQFGLAGLLWLERRWRPSVADRIRTRGSLPEVIAIDGADINRLRASSRLNPSGDLPINCLVARIPCRIA